jgi:hypothetical protein
MVQLGLSSSFEDLGEEESARPFAFKLVADPNSHSSAFGVIQLAAGSEEQREEWLSLFEHFADAVKSQGPAPRSDKMMTPRAIESQLPFGTYLPPQTADAITGPSGTAVADAITFEAPVKPPTSVPLKSAPPTSPTGVKMPGKVPREEPPASPPGGKKPALSAIDLPAGGQSAPALPPPRPTKRHSEVKAANEC